jgi:transmembrane sensor
MNKNIDNINSTEESVKKALDIMECSTEISDRQLQEILEDEEGLQACRDIMDSSLFLQHKRGIELPDVEIELGRFKQKHHTVKMRSIRWKTGIGIAAMIAIIFGAYYFINSVTNPPAAPITVFTADTTPQHITLQENNGEKVVLDQKQSNSQILPKAIAAQSERIRL